MIPDIHLIDLGRGYFAIVDSDSPAIGLKWTATHIRRKTRTYVYAKRVVKDEEGKFHNEYLHRLLTKPTGDQCVDHINRVTLDCRMSNLRVATRSENAQNSMYTTPSKTGFRGVYTEPKGRFRATFRHNQKSINVGCFGTAEEAARAYDKMVREVRGEFSILNFPEEHT